MTAGWAGDQTAQRDRDDDLRQIVGRPFVAAPGARFAYDNGTANLLALALAYQRQVEKGDTSMPFPEDEVTALLDNSWADSARSAVGAWIGLIYQTTHIDRRKLFMDGVDPANPLGIL